jgi:hypothetical protein
MPAALGKKTEATKQRERTEYAVQRDEGTSERG